jgi:hypothetical protein
MIQPDVQWDIGNVSIPFHAKLFVLFLWVALLWVVVRVLQIWWRIGLRSTGIHSLLDGAVILLEKGDRLAIRAAAQKISHRAPERGLREFSSLSDDSSLSDFLPAWERADALFRYDQSYLNAKVQGLLTLAGVTALACFAYVAFDAAHVFDMVQEMKAVSTGAILGAIKETLTLFSFGLVVVCVLFLAHRHLLGRLARRRSHWEYFRVRVENCFSQDNKG